MKKNGIGFLVLVFALLLVWGRPAHAFGVDDITGTGTKIVAVGGIVVVWLDKGLHWTWDVLHGKVVHPLVQTITLGIVDLDAPEE